MNFWLLVSVFLVTLTSSIISVDVDTKGYILYCPCTGGFGNQIDQFLGALAFAKGLDRTLVLPSWTAYNKTKNSTKSEAIHVPFQKWFIVKPLKEYYEKIITMEYFMKNLALKVWPVGQRIGLCEKFDADKKCSQMPNGYPNENFWSSYSVNFDSYEEHTDLNWNMDDEESKTEWLKRYPATTHLVIALENTPGDYPSLPQNQFIQKYIHFSQRIESIADAYIQSELKQKPYLAMHLRNGVEFMKSCSITPRRVISSSQQCTNHTQKNVTYDMCNPSREILFTSVIAAIKKWKLKTLFIASDYNPMVFVFEQRLERKGVQVTVHTRKGKSIEDHIIDLAILAKSNFFIGNCVSSFSAFVRRHRETRNLPIGFFSINYPQSKRQKDEL